MSFNPFYNIDNPELMGYEYAWIRFMKQSVIDSDIISSPIVESWERCKNASLSLDDVSVRVQGETEDREPPGESYQFLKKHGYNLVKEIIEKIDSRYFYGIITDARGRKIVGIQNEKQSLSEDLAKICEIRDFSENAIGTNCFSVVSEIRKPFIVAGAQHYFEVFHEYASYAAPLFDLNKNMIGMVGLYTVTEKMSDYMLLFVTAIEEAIENNLQWFNSKNAVVQQNEEMQYILDTVSDGVMYVDVDNRITYGNRKFMELFGKTPETVVGKDISCLKTVPDIEKLKKMGYSTRKVYRDTKISIVSGKNEYTALECVFNKYKIADYGENNKNEIWAFARYSDIRKRASKLSYENSKSFYFDDIKGNSKSMKIAIELAKKAAVFETRVIIEGDSGTGKEMFAQAIHNEGPRRNGPFVAVDCGALPAGLLESELFGYEEGAYTGARKGGKKGKFELANKGILFLDEITNMPLDMQAKLLRILQEGRLVPVGGNQPVEFDVQVIAATNKNIIQEIDRGSFRKDLFFRLNIIHIKVPPLRERGNDIQFFQSYFLKKYDPKGTKRLSHETMEILNKYDWPGNVRQLENVIERMVILSDGAVIGKENIPEEILSHVMGTGNAELLDMGEERKLEDVCRHYVKRMVAYCEGNVKKASEILGISRVTIYKYLRDEQELPQPPRDA